MKSSLLAAITAALIAASLGAVIWTNSSIQGQISRRVEASLQAVLDTTHEALRIWEEQTIIDISILADSDEVRDLVKAQLQTPRDFGHLVRSDALNRLRKTLRRYVDQHGYVDFAILSKDGVQIASGLDDFLGGDTLAKLDPDTVAQVFNGAKTVGSPFQLPSSRSDNLDINILVGAPVFDEAHEVLAALVFRLDPPKEFSQVTRLGRLGKSGETFVFDKQARLLTPSRFEEDLLRLLPANRSALFVHLRDPGVNTTEGLRPSVARTEQPLTHMAQAAIQGQSGMDLNGYRDYRGVTVVGAWVWDEKLSLGLATEMDKNEATAPIDTIWNLSWIMFGIIAVAVFLLIRVVAHRGRLLATNFGYQQALRARQDVLAIVAHDLKNPINSIALSSSVLSRILEEPNPDLTFAARNLGGIHRAAFRMSRLIEDLLLSARIDAGQLRVRPEDCDLPAFMREFEQFVLPLAAEKSNDYIYSIAPNVRKAYVDADRLSQILSNLIGNAIKFSPPHAAVSVSITAVDDAIEFRIKDCGPGIAPSELPHIFDQYWQAQPGKLGAGLGLYISKGLVEAHGGKIWVESVVGEGTTVCFSVPASKSVAAAQPARRAS